MHTRTPRGRVLIVDDERKAHQTLSTLLGEHGFETLRAPNGYKAMGMLDEWDCDVVLTDLRMPMLDGFELIDKVHETSPDVACIAMTAFDSVESAVEAMKSGAEDYLTKPIDFDAVELVVDRAVERVRDRRELKRLRMFSRSSPATTGPATSGSWKTSSNAPSSSAPAASSNLTTCPTTSAPPISTPTSISASPARASRTSKNTSSSRPKRRPAAAPNAPPRSSASRRGRYATS